MAQPDKNGGTLTSPNRAPAAKVLAGALANNRVASALITALGSWMIPAAIVATSTSTTTDFAALAVGDKILALPVPAGTPASTTGAYFGTVATAGTLPFAAVVGDLYVVLRAVNLDGNNPLTPPAPAELTGRQTGDGGLDF